VEVHQVVHHTALQVILNGVDDDLFAHVDQLDVSEIFLVLVDGLVDLFVIADPIPKIFCGLFRILTFVVGRTGLDLEDVGHDQSLIVTLGLDVDGVDIVGRAFLIYPATASFA